MNVRDYLSTQHTAKVGSVEHWLWTVRLAGQVQRCHVMPMQRKTNVAEHTYNAMTIAFKLCEVNGIDPGPAVMALLFHDTPELVTGDIPATAKWMHPYLANGDSELSQDVDHELDLAEPWRRHFRQNNIPQPGITHIHQDIAKAADMLEFTMTCIEEIRRGNREASLVACANRGLKYLEKYKHVTGLANIRLELDKELSRVCK